MKKLLSIALISVGLGTFVSADTFNLHQGWNLVGSSNSVDLSKDFNNSNVSIVWRYENGQWQYYTPSENIKSEIPSKYTFFTKTSPNEGFWVLASSNIIINTGNSENSQQNNNGILVTDLVAGKIVFTDENGTQISVPDNAKIRITPIEYQVNGNWNGVNCKIENDGTFGKECYIWINESNMKEALENEPVQIVVYKDNNNDYHWGADEPSYFDEENVTLNDLKNININAQISLEDSNNINSSYQENNMNDSNTQNNTITLEKFKKYLADNNLTSIDYDAYNKTYLLGPNQVMVLREDGSGKYHAYDYNENKIYKHEYIKTINKSDDNIYVLDTEDGRKIYMAIIQNEGNGLIKLAFSTPDGKIGTTDVLTLNGNVQDTTLNNIEDVKTLFEDSNITTVSINDDDIKGTWKDEKGDVLTFDNDGNFSIHLAKGGDKEGTYEVENGGVKIHFDNDGMNIYFVPVKKEDGEIEMYAVFSDSDNSDYNVIFGGEVLNLTKQ